MFACSMPKISQVMMKWRRRALHLGRFTLCHNGRRATQLGRFTLWYKGRRATTQLSRFSLCGTTVAELQNSVDLLLGTTAAEVLHNSVDLLCVAQRPPS